MAKKTEVKEETVLTPEPIPEPKEAGKQETLPVNEEVAQLRSKLQSLEDNWKNEQRVSSKHIQKIQDLEARLSDRESDKELQRMMFALIAQGRGETEEETETSIKANKPDLLKQYDDLVKQREAQRQQGEAQRVGDQYRRRVEALGLTPKDRTYREIYRDVRDGFYKEADEQLDELEKAKVVTQPKAEDKQKEIEEAARKMLETEGLLKIDTGASLASGMTPIDAMAAYIKGNITAEEAKKRGAKFV